MRRSKVHNKRRDKRVFSATAGAHPKNLGVNPMRGGFRL